MNHQLSDGNQFNKSPSVLQMTTNNAQILNRNSHYSNDMISESLSIMISTKLSTPLTICRHFCLNFLHRSDFCHTSYKIEQMFWCEKKEDTLSKIHKFQKRTGKITDYKFRDDWSLTKKGSHQFKSRLLLNVIENYFSKRGKCKWCKPKNFWKMWMLT